MIIPFFGLKSTHNFKIMFVCKRSGVCTVNIQIPVIFLQIGILLTCHDFITSRVIIIPFEIQRFGAYFINTVIKFDVGNPVFDRLNNKCSLIIVAVALYFTISSFYQSARIIMIDITISIVNRHIGPVGTS